MEGSDIFSHALVSNQVQLSEETISTVENWVQRVEAAAERVSESNSNLEMALANDRRTRREFPA